MALVLCGCVSTVIVDTTNDGHDAGADAGEARDGGRGDSGQAADAGRADAGFARDAGQPDSGQPDAGFGVDAGVVDAGVPLVTPVGAWAWVPVDGTECGSGARAGLGFNRATGDDDLLLFFQGGGACWNSGSCIPSPLQYGPVCSYSQDCAFDALGGLKPMATFVTVADPFPADGGGAFPAERDQLDALLMFNRDHAENAFRHASFAYVPYCTGDLHAGRAVRAFPYQAEVNGAVLSYSMHFSGAANVDRVLERLVATLPNVKRVWLVGASAGGYGAQLNFDRVARAFPRAEVLLLVDSSALIDTVHWGEWVSEWNMRLPEGCLDCTNGLSRVAVHVGASPRNRRWGLLSNDHDRIVSWFFDAAPGPEAWANPPVAQFVTKLEALEAANEASANAKHFIIAGDNHLLLQGYGTIQSDGGVSAPMPSRDGGTDLRAWVDAWATGSPLWQSTR